MKQFFESHDKKIVLCCLTMKLIDKQVDIVGLLPNVISWRFTKYWQLACCRIWALHKRRVRMGGRMLYKSRIRSFRISSSSLNCLRFIIDFWVIFRIVCLIWFLMWKFVFLFLRIAFLHILIVYYFSPHFFFTAFILFSFSVREVMNIIVITISTINIVNYY